METIRNMQIQFYYYKNNSDLKYKRVSTKSSVSKSILLLFKYF